MKSNVTFTGIGFVGALQIVFIVLKLIGTIDWSWWWVLSPILIRLAILAIAAVVCIVGMIVSYIAEKRN